MRVVGNVAMFGDSHNNSILTNSTFKQSPGVKKKLVANRRPKY
jgi:hypothetical protein